MSKFFHLTKNPVKNYHKRKLFPVMKINIRIINIAIIALIVVVSVSYLIQINSLATKGYQIKELEKKVDELKQQKADLELEALSLQSMGVVKEKIADLGMVLAGETDYLQPTPVVVAR